MVCLPDALHRAQADASHLGDHAARPMGGSSGRLAARQCQDFGHGRRRQRFLAGLAGLVAQQPVDTLLGEALLPSPYRRPAGLGLARHGQHRQAVGRQENDPSSLNVLLWSVAIADDRSQSHAIPVTEKNTDGLCHAPRIAWPRPVVAAVSRYRRINPWLVCKRWLRALPGRAGGAVVETTVD